MPSKALFPALNYCQIGEINATDAAALDSKADLGLSPPPNPLVGIADTGVWAGFRLGVRSLEQILCVRWGDRRPTAWPKSMVPPPP